METTFDLAGIGGSIGAIIAAIIGFFFVFRWGGLRLLY